MNTLRLPASGWKTSNASKSCDYEKADGQDEALLGLIEKRKALCDAHSFARGGKGKPCWCDDGPAKAFLESLAMPDNGRMEKAVKFVEAALQNKAVKQRPHILGGIEAIAADRANKIGIPLDGKTLALDHDGVIHTIKQHGGENERLRGQEPITAEDVANFGILFNQAEIKRGSPEKARDGTSLIEGTAFFMGYEFTIVAKVRKLDVVPYTMHKRKIK